MRKTVQDYATRSVSTLPDGTIRTRIVSLSYTHALRTMLARKSMTRKRFRHWQRQQPIIVNK